MTHALILAVFCSVIVRFFSSLRSIIYRGVRLLSRAGPARDFSGSPYPPRLPRSHSRPTRLPLRSSLAPSFLSALSVLWHFFRPYVLPSGRRCTLALLCPAGTQSGDEGVPSIMAPASLFVFATSSTNFEPRVSFGPFRPAWSYPFPPFAPASAHGTCSLRPTPCALLSLSASWTHLPRSSCPVLAMPWWCTLLGVSAHPWPLLFQLPSILHPYWSTLFQHCFREQVALGRVSFGNYLWVQDSCLLHCCAVLFSSPPIGCNGCWLRGGRASWWFPSSPVLSGL